MLLALGLLLVTLGRAQSGQMQFLPVEQELSQNTATTILQDKNGFLWIGTRSGLNRYDGINMVNYYHDEEDSLSLPNNYVRTLFETKEGIIWIGTEGGGLCRYDEYIDSFVPFGLEGSEDQLSGATIYAIYEDQNENLWVGTQNNGLNLVDYEQNKIFHFRPNSDDPFSISANHVSGITQDQFDNIWIATWGGGMNLFDNNTRRFIRYIHDPKNTKSISSNVIRTMYKGPSENIFIGTEEGLNKLVHQDKGQFVFEKTNLGFQGSTVVLSVVEDSENRIWIGTENNGVFVGDKDLGNFTQHVSDPTFEYSIQNNSIWSLHQDRTGIIWVGTFNKGLYKVDDKLRNFRSFKHSTYHDNSVSNNSVSAFVEDKNGNVWIGTDGGGLDHWDIDANSFTHFNESNSLVKNEVLALLIDSRENLWVGTWYGGLLRKEKNSKEFKRFHINHPVADNPGTENVFSIIEDSKSRIWIALYRQGLVMYDPKSNDFGGFQNETFDDKSISSDYVRCLVEDREGRLWIGTEGGGLNLLQEKNGSFSFLRFLNSSNDPNSISSNSVLSIVQDESGDLWIGTASGLNNFDIDNDEWTKYGRRDGLPDDVIYAIEIDEQQKLWLSSNKGLSKFDPRIGLFQNFDIKDGLQSMEFFKNSSYQLSTGEMLFGGVEGFNLFDPSAIKENNEQPDIYLSNFKISNRRVRPAEKSPLTQPIRQAEEINLKHDENDFGFEFSLLSFRQSDRNEYAYQLENYNDDWQEIGNRREASFTNVPPGDYVFKVKATTGGRWSSNEVQIDIHIATPWYASNLSYFLYFAAAIAILIITFRTIVNRERLQNQLRIDQMELSKMQELDEMKSSFFANISHEFRSPLTLILGPLKAMKELGDLKLSSSQVDVMIRNAESLLKLINQLLELSKLESGKMKLEIVKTDLVDFLKPIVHSFSSLANQKMVNYKIDFPAKEVNLYFDKEKIEKVMVNLISNALKFTPDFGNIKIKIENSEDDICISVIDSGIGIPKDELGFVFNRYYRVKRDSSKKQKGTGIGLSLTKELVEIHQGRIEVISEENKGSTFNVYLKKGKKHFHEEEIIENIKSNFYYEKAIEYSSEEISDKEIDPNIRGSLEGQMEKRPQILVIEDNDDIRMYIRQILEGEYLVSDVANGKLGLEMALEQVPDMIISDVMMPGITGFELCQKIKEDVKTSHIPVLLLTAKASDDSAVEGFEVGADYYITKPFEPRLLSLRVRNALKIANQIREKLLNKETLQIEPKNVQIPSKDKDFIDRAVSIVEDNMANSEFYVDDLGKELGLSRMQLYRKLKALVGQSANEFVRSLRLKRAAQMIGQDQLTISEITYQVGFNDLQYFRDCFKKQFGVNPSEYANQSQKADT